VWFHCSCFYIHNNPYLTENILSWNWNISLVYLSEKSTIILVTSYKCLWWVQCPGLLGLTIQEFCFGFCACVTITNFLQPNLLITMFWQDPVCGSAHCVLAPYWGGKLGKHKLTAFQVRSCTTLVFPWSVIDWVLNSSIYHQASTRSGTLYLELEAAHKRVRIQGEAVSVMTGTLLA
jgi:hypothetical protein